MNNNKATSGQHGQHTRNGYMRLLGVMVALACVLVMAVRIALAALTYAGPITVTANMGSFSPSLVQVNSPATASLSAYYTPPSGVPEGQLSASYDWSVSQVQYKGAQADQFGSPPANSYTDSISPNQPSASSGATLAFTPKIAGYWQVATSCSVTVTDTTTNQYWSGSASAGPEELISATLTMNPNGGTSVFLNTKNYVVVTVAPSDLAPDTTLNISGGATFANEVTSEAMTSATEDVYFYGQNVYGSGGSEGSGQISATISAPTSGGNSSALAMRSLAMAAVSSGGGNLSAQITLNSFAISKAYTQAVSFVGSALDSTATSVFGLLEQHTNTYLLSVGSGSGPQAVGAQQMYDNLNYDGGYTTIQNNLSTAFNDVLTGTNAANSAQSSSVDAKQGTVPLMPAFPASAIKNFTVAPSLSVSFNYPYISPNGTWQPPKLGDLLVSFGVDGTAQIDYAGVLAGTWTGSLSASLSPGHNFELQDGTYTASSVFNFKLNSSGASFQFTVSGNYQPADGKLGGQVLASYVVNW